MKSTLEVLRKNANETIEFAQKKAVMLYNLEDYAEKIDELRVIAGEDHSFRVGSDFYLSRDFHILIYLKEDEGLKSGRAPSVLQWALDNWSERISEDDYPDSQMKEWTFRGYPDPNLSIRVYYGASDSCKRVGTGEFEAPKEKTILVCG